MTAIMRYHYLSHHSSNPLQVPSDDLINASYVEQLRPILAIEKSRAARGLSPKTSSTPVETHHAGYEEQEFGSQSGTSTTRRQEVIDLEDEDGEHEIYDRDVATLAGLDDEDDEDDGVRVHLDAPGIDHKQLDGSPNDKHRREGWEGGEYDVEDEVDEFDEEKTIFSRHPTERAQIESELRDLERTVPRLLDEYKLLDRLGEGTFSSVYKALDIKHSQYYNQPWQHPRLSSSSIQPPAKFFVALKRIYVTSSPSRIANEIAILEDCRGCRNVSQLVTAFRSRDQIVAVMPFSRNVDFRDYYHSMSLPGIQSYFRCLFRALRDIHARGIVHRDIKPANFLFNPQDKFGTLCDFGLAQRVETSTNSPCLHTSPSHEDPHGKRKLIKESQSVRIKEKILDARRKAAGPSDKVGIPVDETRPNVKANRAGTRGFRAPEVLFKCPDQSVALDIWSAGTILLSILGCRFPIFSASDDVEALMEIATVLGKRSTEKCARLHNRTFSTNVPEVDHQGISWAELACRINPYLYQTAPLPTPPPDEFDGKRPIRSLPRRSLGATSASTSTVVSSPPPSSTRAASEPADSPSFRPPTKHNILIDMALDLLERCMHWDPTARLTAREALYHPFLAGDEPDDDLCPHPFGEGSCGDKHYRDETGDEPCIWVGLGRSAREGRHAPMVGKILAAGEGIAYGDEPCEFHADGESGVRDIPGLEGAEG